ncbi:TPA: hypothetical protein ACJKEI_001808, partial [Neisseria meningitidis]
MKKYLPLLRFLLIACISAFLAWKGQPFVHGNEKAVDLIINVFAILAGFLIAIMTLFSDMRFDEDANWRQIQIREGVQEQRYIKHSLLFYTYLAVLVCVFIVILLAHIVILLAHKEEYKNGPAIFWLERSYLFLACISIFYSVFLPGN